MMEPKESKSSKHFKFSMAKSAIRFVGYLCMALSGIQFIVIAGWLLIIAEILGIHLHQHKPNEQTSSEIKNIVVNINAGDYLPERKFPKSKWVELMKGLNDQFPEAVYSFSGLKNEADEVISFSETLSDVIPESRRNVLAGTQDLKAFIETLKQCDLFLTNDSGPLHLAHFYGVKTVCVWGPTSSYLVGYPNSSSMLNLSQQKACSPCFISPKSDVAKACNRQLSCFQEMETSDMLDQIVAFVR